MYRVVASAGLRAYQLDRHRALLSDKADAEAVQQAVQTAVLAADCVLATYQHASQLSFPFTKFCAVVEYAPEAARASQGPAALARLSDVRRVALTVSVDAHALHQEGMKGHHEAQAAGNAHWFGRASEAMIDFAVDRHIDEEPSAGQLYLCVTSIEEVWKHAHVTSRI